MSLLLVPVDQRYTLLNRWEKTSVFYLHWYLCGGVDGDDDADQDMPISPENEVLKCGFMGG